MTVGDHRRDEDVQNPKAYHKNATKILGDSRSAKFSFAHERCKASKDEKSNTECCADGVRGDTGGQGTSLRFENLILKRIESIIKLINTHHQSSH